MGRICQSHLVSSRYQPALWYAVLTWLDRSDQQWMAAEGCGIILVPLSLIGIVYLPSILQYYVAGFAAAMIPCTMIKEVNSDKVRRSAIDATAFSFSRLS